MRQVGATKRDERLGERVRVLGFVRRVELDYGFHRFAEIGIRYAKYGSIENGFMTYEQIFDFLWVDVDAARDHHEGLAIFQIQVTLIVEVAHIA